MRAVRPQVVRNPDGLRSCGVIEAKREEAGHSINEVDRPSTCCAGGCHGELNALVVEGVLSGVRIGRDRLFVNTDYLDLLSRPEKVA